MLPRAELGLTWVPHMRPPACTVAQGWLLSPHPLELEDLPGKWGRGPGAAHPRLGSLRQAGEPSQRGTWAPAQADPTALFDSELVLPSGPLGAPGRVVSRQKTVALPFFLGQTVLGDQGVPRTQ